MSFDYDNDRDYKYLLEAWNANPYFDFCFSDLSCTEIKTEDISRVKAGLTTKINQATYTLVIVGSEANKKHKDSIQIGYKNWQNFEIAKSKANNNKLIGVKINSLYASPEELLGCGTKWATSFTKNAILKALEEA